MSAAAFRHDLIAIGEGMVEFTAEGAFDRAARFRRGFAGDAVNTLVQAARLGLRVALLSRIGDDPFAPALRAAWAAEGIDLAAAPVVPGLNGLYFVLVDDRGERRFHYRRAGSAASAMGPDALDPSLVAGARFVLVSGITQAISASAEALVAAFAAGPEAPARGVYDPNHRPALWAARGGDAAARRAFAAVAPRMAWLLPSHPADLAVLGLAAATPPEAAFAAFEAAGPARVALKLGAEGAIVRDGGLVQRVPAPPVADVVDTTGAGDAWNAGFIAALLRGKGPAAAAAAAHAVAARTLRHPGAIPPREG